MSRIQIQIKMATEQIKKVLNDYIIGMTQRETERIEKIFIPAAQMFLIKDGQLVQIPIFNGLVDYIKTTPKDENAKGKILLADITGNAASGKVEVVSAGSVFTDFFTLLKIGNEWKIVNKIYTVTKA